MVNRKILYAASTTRHLRMFHLPYLRWFSELGYEIHTVTGDNEGPLPYVSRAFYAPMVKKPLTPANRNTVSIIQRLLETEGYQMVSTHTQLASFFVRMAVGKMKHRPLVVTTVHGYLFDADNGWVRRLIVTEIEKKLAKFTDLLIVMNDEDEKIAGKYGLYGKRLLRIKGMGIQGLDTSIVKEVKEPLFATKDAYVLLYAAEFSKRKNHVFLIKALSKLPANICLLCLGEGKTEHKCRRLAERLGLQERVKFLGQVPNTTPYLKYADIAVSASRYEGIPFHIMEALREGLCVVASNVKGNRDLLENVQDCALYPYNDIKSFCRQIIKMSEQKNERYNRLRREYMIDKVFPVLTQAYLDELKVEESL